MTYYKTLMPILMTGVLVSPITMAASKVNNGLPAEEAARIAADALLHERINDIQLTPGPQGDAGPQGVPGVAGL